MIDISKYNNELRYRGNNLFLENVALDNIAKKFKTPTFCYSSSVIANNFNIFKHSFKKIEPLICYAMKANFNSYIIKILEKLGSGIDVVSKGELKKCLDNGVSANKIVFSGVGKTDDEIEFALKNEIKQINVESLEELKDIEKICKKLRVNTNVCLRVNPDINAKTHDKISTGRLEDKFGIPNDQIKYIFQNYNNNKFINIIGLSIHIGSQIESLDPFRSAFKKIKKQVLDLRKSGFQVSTIDLGGGIGIKYNEKSRIVDVEMYTNLIEELFSDMKLKIIIEPGRYIVGSSGIILTRVIRVKKGKDKNFLILDAGMNNLLRPALYGAKHSIFPVKLSSKRKVLYDIVGPICESSDVFMKNAKIQELNKDDLVVISSTGAYSSCMASDYNLRPKAQEVFVKEKKTRVSNS